MARKDLDQITKDGDEMKPDYKNWMPLTKSHFFQRFYPETEGCAGYHSFGFNRKEQLIRLAVFPFVAALMALIAMWIGGQL